MGFKVKWRADGSLERYKAWFVAKELNQEEGVDYFETFNPVVRPTIIRLVLYCHLLWLGHSPT